MTTKERCAEVESLPYVYKAIPGSPCFGLTKEFLLENNITICIQPWEYDIENPEFAAKVRIFERYVALDSVIFIRLQVVLQIIIELQGN